MKVAELVKDADAGTAAQDVDRALGDEDELDPEGGEG